MIQKTDTCLLERGLRRQTCLLERWLPERNKMSWSGPADVSIFCLCLIPHPTLSTPYTRWHPGCSAGENFNNCSQHISHWVRKGLREKKKKKSWTNLQSQISCKKTKHQTIYWPTSGLNGEQLMDLSFQQGEPSEEEEKEAEAEEELKKMTVVMIKKKKTMMMMNEEEKEEEEEEETMVKKKEEKRRSRTRKKERKKKKKNIMMMTKQKKLKTRHVWSATHPGLWPIWMGELLQQLLDERVAMELLVPRLLQLLFAKSKTLPPLLQLGLRVSVGTLVTQRAALRLEESACSTSHTHMWSRERPFPLWPHHPNESKTGNLRCPHQMKPEACFASAPPPPPHGTIWRILIASWTFEPKFSITKHNPELRLPPPSPPNQYTHDHCVCTKATPHPQKSAKWQTIPNPD